jgi:PAS domain S-box-containing protein
VLAEAPLVLWAIDIQGVFTLSEGAALAGLGLEPGQVVGASAFELYAESQDIVRNLRRGLAGEEFSSETEVDDRVFETQHSPIRDEGDNIVGLLGVSMDITGRRRAEEERSSLQAQLLQVQKLESLGLLAGGIAHDFNNILTVIMGSAATASMVLAEDHPARTDVDNVVAAAERAADLTRQLLAYAGKGRFEVKPIDLSRLTRDMSALVETSISKKVQLRLELATELPTVEADVAQMQQVIMNLVINAAEAIGEQEGTVRLITGVQQFDAADDSQLYGAEELQPGRYVYIQVCDSGCGMDEQTTQKIFDPFYSTKFTGRGLGLAAVLGIARAHEGAIKVDSTPGEGSCFSLFLPASNAEPAAIERAHPSFRGDGLALLIDDDSNVRDTVRRMLEDCGFTVIEAADGADGVDVFRRHAAEIAVVLLDMTMPKLNGEEVYREIRALRQDVPVILNSGYDEVDATQRIASEGPVAFVQKPFNSGQLAEKLSRVFKIS